MTAPGGTPTAFDELVGRSQAVVAAADAACTVACRLVLEARSSQRRSIEARDVARRLRHRSDRANRLRPCPAGPAEAFAISGEVEGTPTFAHWSREEGLVCPPELRRRADAIVAMGDTFGGQADLPVLDASLDAGGNSTAVLLTVLRAFSSVTSIDVVALVVDDVDVPDVAGFTEVPGTSGFIGLGPTVAPDA